ncbi:MAG: CBS domain-containing protein [Syntrophomonadaceae bacterium]|jgi:CBS domain-containing protein
MVAKDIMTKDVITAGPEEQVEKVTKLMLENKISGIPVVDNERHVLGMVTEKDLMVKAGEVKVPFYLTLFDSIIFLENPIRFSNDLKKYAAVKVKDVMTTRVVVIEEDKPVNEIVKIMQQKKINRIPVVRHDKLVGIITRNDILKSLVKSNG